MDTQKPDHVTRCGFFAKGGSVPEWLIAHSGGTFGTMRFDVDCDIVHAGGRYWILPRAADDIQSVITILNSHDVYLFAPTSDVVVPFRFQVLGAEPS